MPCPYNDHDAVNVIRHNHEYIAWASVHITDCTDFAAMVFLSKKVSVYSLSS